MKDNKSVITLKVSAIIMAIFVTFFAIFAAISQPYGVEKIWPSATYGVFMIALIILFLLILALFTSQETLNPHFL